MFLTQLVILLTWIRIQIQPIRIHITAKKERSYDYIHIGMTPVSEQRKLLEKVTGCIQHNWPVILTGNNHCSLNAGLSYVLCARVYENSTPENKNSDSFRAFHMC